MKIGNEQTPLMFCILTTFCYMTNGKFTLLNVSQPNKFALPLSSLSVISALCLLNYSNFSHIPRTI